MLVRSRQKALVPAYDQMRVPPAQFVRAQALLFQLPVPEVFPEPVRVGQPPGHHLAVFRLDEIKHHAALAAIEQWKERDAHSAEAAGLVTRGWLDLDDFG